MGDAVSVQQSLGEAYAGKISFPSSFPKHRYSKFAIMHSLPFGYQVGIHNNCWHNELYSLVHRHGVVRDVPFDAHLWAEHSLLTIEYFRKQLTPAKFKDIIDNYDGAKKRRYIAAAAYIREHGLQEKHRRVKLFIKQDKFPVSRLQVKAPRSIQFRSPEFNLVLQKYINPFEHEYCSSLSVGVVSGTRVIAKGLNQQDRAELFLAKARKFTHPKYYMGDHTTFDSYVNVDHLRTTHKVYNIGYGSRELLRLLKAQINNRGRTNSGIRYKIEGTRMSGDADTGIGNTIINIFAIMMVLRIQNISKYDFILDGDDFVIILEEEQKFVNRFDLTGFHTEITSTLNLQRVEFCQSRIVLEPFPMFVRSFERCISNSRICRKEYPTMYAWLNAVMMCEYSLYGHLPLYNSFYGYITRDGPVVMDRDTKWRMGDQGFTLWRKDVKDLTRISYSNAWGTGVDEQKEIERVINAISMFEVSSSSSSSYKKNDKPLRIAWQTFQSLAECSRRSWWECSEGCSGSCCELHNASRAGIQYGPNDDGFTPRPATQ